jgi:hypothetical protein
LHDALESKRRESSYFFIGILSLASSDDDFSLAFLNLMCDTIFTKASEEEVCAMYNEDVAHLILDGGRCASLLIPEFLKLHADLRTDIARCSGLEVLALQTKMCGFIALDDVVLKPLSARSRMFFHCLQAPSSIIDELMKPHVGICKAILERLSSDLYV